MRQQNFAHLSAVFSQVSTRLTILACLALLSLPGRSAQLAALQELVPAPALSLPDTRDQIHDLACYRGRVVLVNFWASWCPSCVLEIPVLPRIVSRFEGQGFSLLAVNVGERKSAVYRFPKFADPSAAVLLDAESSTFKRWGETVYPSSYLIDRSGRVRFVAEGALDWHSTVNAAAIEMLLTEDTLVPGTRLVSPCYGVPE